MNGAPPADINALVVYCGRKQWQVCCDGEGRPRWTSDVVGIPEHAVARARLQHLNRIGVPLDGGLPILFLEPVAFSRAERRALARSCIRVLEELGEVGPMRFESEAVMALRAVGRDSGVALRVGRDSCSVAAVREGVVLEHTAQLSPLGSCSVRHPDVLEVLFRPSLVLGWKTTVAWEVQRLLWLGRKNAFAECPFGGMPKDLVRMLARHLCVAYPGVDTLMADCLAAVQHGELRRRMRASVVLYGDNSMHEGLAARLCRQSVKCAILAVEEREHLAIAGAAAVVMEETDNWITPEEFANRGLGALARLDH